MFADGSFSAPATRDMEVSKFDARVNDAAPTAPRGTETEVVSVEPTFFKVSPAELHFAAS